MTAGSTQTDTLDRGTWLALIAMALGVFVIANDFTALSVAIPQIEIDLTTTLPNAQWVINGYALVFGVLIVTGGRLADLYGRKRMFMIGATIFAVFSLIGGLMPTVELLIAGRALMGIGGAMMWPAILGMTYAILPDSKAGSRRRAHPRRRRARQRRRPDARRPAHRCPQLALGVLREHPDHRCSRCTSRNAEVTEQPTIDASDGIDYRGIATLSVGIVAILIALDEGPDDGFGEPGDPGAVRSRRDLARDVLPPRASASASSALVPRDVLKNRVFAAACLSVLLMSAIFFAALLYLPQYMEKVLDFARSNPAPACCR